VTNLNLEKLLQDLKRTLQYSKDESGDSNIVKTMKHLQEQYTELSEKVKVNHGILT